jgi:Tfp pilus assembly protein PilO
MKNFQALQEKPWYVQASLFGVVGLVLFGLVWYFVNGPTRAETAEMQAKIDVLLADNARAQAAEQRLNDFRGSYARVQSEYEDLKALLPERRELTMVLANLQDRARGQLSVRKFAPKTEEQQDFYSSKLIEVGVSGSYNKLGAFFQQLASYQRIVSITDFKLTGLDRKNNDSQDQILKGRTVNADFKLKAYYASPAAPQAAAAKPASAAAAQPVVNPAAPAN